MTNRTRNTLKIVFMNRKGGAGKTALTILVASELQRRGYKVLVIDCDSQHNTTDFYFYKEKQVWREKFFDGELKESEDIDQYPIENNITDMLYESKPAAECIHIKPCGEIIPAVLGLASAEGSIKEEGAEKLYKLKDMIEPLDGLYDFILFDVNASAIDIATQNVLTAVDYVIPPVDCKDGVDALPQTVGFVNGYRKRGFNSDLTILGYVYSNYIERDNMTKFCLNRLERTAEALNRKIVGDYKPGVLDSKVHRTADCKKTLGVGKQIAYEKRADKAQQDIEKLVTEILKKMKTTPKGKDLVVKSGK